MTSYPPNMTLRPLLAWPRAETVNRRRSPFRSTWSDTVELLRRELRQLDGGTYYPDTVLQLALREQDFRLTDGLPRANAIPSMPGVILNIESTTAGPLSYPCDAFDRWTDNLRAIALGLEALRKVGRYGITPGNEQYRGWRAIEANGSHPAWSADEAEQFLRGLVKNEGNGKDLGTLPQIWRRVRRDTHPDRNGGDRTIWDKVEHAGNVLEAAGAL